MDHQTPQQIEETLKGTGLENLESDLNEILADCMVDTDIYAVRLIKAVEIVFNDETMGEVFAGNISASIHDKVVAAWEDKGYKEDVDQGDYNRIVLVPEELFRD